MFFAEFNKIFGYCLSAIFFVYVVLQSSKQIYELMPAPPLIITPGEPAGIGAEISLKAWQAG